MSVNAIVAPMLNPILGAILGGGGGGSPPVDISTVFGVNLWAGNATSQTIANNLDLDTEGGLVWIKNRQNVSNHRLFDTERGIDLALSSDDITIQATETNSLNAFNNNGYSLGSHAGVNNSGDNFVGWSWRKSPRFFDVIAYDGDNILGHEIPHELGIDVGMVIVKVVDAGNQPWAVQHISRSATKTLTLDTSVAEIAVTNIWGDTNPTDTVVSLGQNNRVNDQNLSYIMYVFAHDPSPDGVIQCGSYVGVGGNNSPFVDLGWRPQLVFIKVATTGGNWFILDAARSTQPNLNQRLFPDATFTEDTVSDWLLTTDTGFNSNSTGQLLNGVGQTYIFMAIREA